MGLGLLLLHFFGGLGIPYGSSGSCLGLGLGFGICRLEPVAQPPIHHPGAKKCAFENSNPGAPSYLNSRYWAI